MFSTGIDDYDVLVPIMSGWSLAQSGNVVIK